MKKIIIFLIISLSLSQSVFPQIAFYDSKKLKFDTIDNKLILASNAENLKILANYVANDSVSATAIEQAFKGNPFFTLAGNRMGASKFSGLSLSSIGSLNVTNIADGIAQFLIKRGKEELNVAFFNRLKKFLDDPKHPECKTLFPVTVEFLGRIETYRYAELIQSLREAFHKDLSNLLVNLNELIDLPKYKELLKDLPEIRVAIRTSKIVSELSQSEEGILPDSLIHQLASLEEWTQINSNLGNSWKLLDIISQSIRYVPVPDPPNTGSTIVIDTVIQTRKRSTTTSGRNVPDTVFRDTIITQQKVKSTDIKQATPDSTLKRRWIKLSDFNALVKDPIILKIFIGLLYQQIKNQDIQFTVKGDTIHVHDFMKQHATTINVISGLVENFSVLATDVDRTIKDFKDKQANGTLNNDDYYTYIGKAINITEYGFKVANTIKENVVDDDYIIMARNANELYKNIYTKNYNNAIMNAYSILNQAFNKLLENPRISDAIKARIKSLSPGAETIEKILKYGNFMASVVKAESGEDVQAALEAATLPAGSYSIKQKSAFNVAVNGYIGYNFDFNGGVYAKGIYAPVGISISAGSRKKWGPTFTGFISLIDVGSIAAYRLQDDSTKKLKQEVRLESIFSPAVQFLIEPIHGFPIAVGAGWRRTPKLFYSDKTSFSTVPSKNVFNVSILVDIPMFNITNKTFVKK